MNEAITAFGKHEENEPAGIDWDGLNDDSSAVDHSGTELKIKDGRRSTNPYTDGDGGVPEVIPAPKHQDETVKCITTNSYEAMSKDLT